MSRARQSKVAPVDGSNQKMSGTTAFAEDRIGQLSPLLVHAQRTSPYFPLSVSVTVADAQLAGLPASQI